MGGRELRAFLGKRRREREKKNVGKEEKWICEWKTLEN